MLVETRSDALVIPAIAIQQGRPTNENRGCFPVTPAC